MKKLSNTEAKLKKSVAYKKKHVVWIQKVKQPMITMLQLKIEHIVVSWDNYKQKKWQPAKKSTHIIINYIMW